MPPDPILAAFAELVNRRGEAPLVASPSRKVSVGELDRLAGSVAASLRPTGLGPGDLVGLTAANGAGFLGGWVALRRLGCTVLLLDHGLREVETASVVEHLRARGVVRCRRPWPRGAEDFRFQAAPGAAAQVDPEIAVVKLTSGSTGRPRGVLVPATCLAADEAALTRTMGLGDGERCLATIPMSHSYGLASLVLPALVRGSLVVVAETNGPFSAIAAARAADVTFFPTVPSYLEALVATASPPAWPASLRLVVAAGAPLAPATARRFREVFGRPVHAFYGASECGGICFDREGTAGERGSVGTPVDGVEVELEAIDRAAGDGRRLVVESPAVARGYYPEADCRLAGGRFVTGDTAERRGGELFLLGRVDDLVIVKGKKVDPREVERAVGELAGVDEVVALGVPVANRAGQILQAVVASRSADLSCAQIKAWCRTRLAEHKVPRSLILVRELPRTGRGKLDREALRKLRPEAGSESGEAG